jgi:hypothetical protein
MGGATPCVSDEFNESVAEGAVPCFPPRSIVADARRRSRSYVLAALRALHLDLRFAVSRSAAVEENSIAGMHPMY